MIRRVWIWLFGPGDFGFALLFTVAAVAGPLLVLLAIAWLLGVK